MCQNSLANGWRCAFLAVEKARMGDLVFRFSADSRGKKMSASSLVHTFTPWVPSPSLDVFWVRARRYKAKAQGSVSRGELSPLF